MKTKDKSNSLSMILVAGITAIVVVLLAIGCYFLKKWMDEEAIWKKLVEYRHEEVMGEMTKDTAETVVGWYPEGTTQFYYTVDEAGEKTMAVIIYGVDLPEEEKDKALLLYQSATIYLATIEDLDSCTVYLGEEMNGISAYAIQTVLDSLNLDSSIVEQLSNSGLVNYEKMPFIKVTRDDVEDELEISDLYKLSETKKTLKKLIKKQLPEIEMPELDD